MIGGNVKVVKSVNRALILNLIREHQPISRIQIAKMTGLNKSTVSSVVAELLDEQLLIEEEDRDRNVGRNPINLRLQKGRHFVGAINIDARLTRIAMMDIDGSFAGTASLETVVDNPEDFVMRCVAELRTLKKSSEIALLRGIGVSIAGIVDSTQSEVIVAPNLKWKDFRIGEIIDAAWQEAGIVVVDNDSNASALAEMWFGSHAMELRNFVFLSVGPGIGAGIVIDKKLVRGESHASGEFGHMTIFEGGQLCSCGNKGCLESYASSRAVVRRYADLCRLHPDEAARLTFADIMARAEGEEAEARAILLETGRFLGMGVAKIVNALDPQAIIIGGRIIQVWDTIYPEMFKTISQRSFFGKPRDIKILPSSLAADPRLVGAGTLVIKELFNDYKIIL